MTNTAPAIATPTSSTRAFSPAVLAVAMVVAIVVNVIVFLIASAAGASMRIDQPSEMQLNFGIVIVATLVPLGLAGVALWFLAGRWPVLRTVAAWTGLALALASAASPLLVSADIATGVALGFMHLVAGLAWFVGIRNPAN